MPVKMEWSAAQDAELRRLRAACVTWDEVAVRMGIGRNTGIERARRIGIQKRGAVQPPPPVVVEAIDRRPRPAGHPDSWDAITRGTVLEGEAYPYPVFDL